MHSFAFDQESDRKVPVENSDIPSMNKTNEY